MKQSTVFYKAGLTIHVKHLGNNIFYVGTLIKRPITHNSP